MKKHKVYTNVRFNAEVLKEAVDVFQGIAQRLEKDVSHTDLSVKHHDSTWADYRQYKDDAYLAVSGQGLRLSAHIDSTDCSIAVTAFERVHIETVFDVFEKNVEGCRLPPVPKQASKPVVFIGHGRSRTWNDLKDHLQDKHGIKIEAYESGARAGYSKGGLALAEQFFFWKRAWKTSPMYTVSNI
jgi:hypothetical protein